jgi:hypothetical protein
LIPAGSGPISTFSYQSTSVYESTITLSIVESVLSDGNGQEIDHIGEDGTVEVSGEEPPPEAPDTPTGLMAEAADSEVVLSWNPSFGADEYLIYREEGSSGTTGGGTGGGDLDYVDCAGLEFDNYDPIYSSYDCVVCDGTCEDLTADVPSQTTQSYEL